MKKLFVPLVCCMAVLLLQCAPPQAPAVDTAAEAEAVKQADQAWSDAAKTFEGHMQYFADNAIVMGQNEPVVSGKANIEKMLTEMHAMPGFSVSWNVKSAEVAASGDLAYTMGSYDFAVQDTSGAPMNDKGKYLTIWKKQEDGSWKVAVDAFSSDMPAH